VRHYVIGLGPSIAMGPYCCHLLYISTFICRKSNGKARKIILYLSTIIQVSRIVAQAIAR